MSNAFPISYGPFTNSFILLVSEYGVVHTVDAAGTYRVRSLAAAATLCQAKGMVVATRDQLDEARQLGLDRCRCGWLADGTVGFPVVTPRAKCGDPNLPAGVRMCPASRPYNSVGWDTYCVKIGKHFPLTCAYL